MMHAMRVWLSHVLQLHNARILIGAPREARTSGVETKLIEEFVADRAGLGGGPLPSAAQNITLINTRSAR